MPKTFSVPLLTYTPNSDGTPRIFPPLPLDGLTRDNTDCIDFRATVRPDWTAGVLLFSLEVAWDNGFSSAWNVTGDPVNQDGTPATVWVARSYVPREGGMGDKTDVASGTAVLTVHAPFSSAFSAEAKVL